MKIGILGAGKIGAVAARLFVEAGNQVAVSNSRGPESLAALVRQLGPAAQAMSIAGVARWGEVVLLAIPWHRMKVLPVQDLANGKIVIDAMNPYRPEGGFFELGNSTSSEEVLRHLPGANLVKAFNTIYYKDLAERGRDDLPLEQRHAIYLAGDSEQSKKVVADLIFSIGFGPVDTGSLHSGGRLQQPDSPIYNQTLTVREAREFLKKHAAGALQ